MPSFAQDAPRRVATPHRLRRRLRAQLGGASIVVLANSEPFRHHLTPDGRVEVQRSSGGLVTALEPLMQASRGVWVAHGAGNADRLVVDEHDGVDVPSDNPTYRLRRVWLEPAEVHGYYEGFANEGLWPLCHRTAVRPVFRSGDFDTYRAVNARFVAAVCDEAETSQPVVLVQDYHFALAPRMLNVLLPQATVVAFWHVPWPSWRTLAQCPWAAALLHGLLGSTIVGFQSTADRDNFLDAAEVSVGAAVDRVCCEVRYGGRTTAVRVYPVSVEWPSPWAAALPPAEQCRRSVCDDLGLPPEVAIGVGVDRMDYTKGIQEKFLAVERFLEGYPEFRNRFVFIQVAEPTRTTLTTYRELRDRLRTTVQRINQRFESNGWRPIILREVRHEPPDVYRLMRAADVCYVGSLHDGMNLVAKEFAAARDDERGVLVLSRFAGASKELRSALMVDPNATDACARALRDAVSMPVAERAWRMRAMRSVLARHNAATWALELIDDALRFRSDRDVSWAVEAAAV